MEISGKVLREVEFRDRLRGYDTDEVDEFLESVAVSVDELLGELASLRDRSARGRPPREDVVVPDDDSIARTLLLAQRMADLAVKEANEEADRVLENARAEARSLVDQAENHALAMRTEAERGLEERVARLTKERDQIEREVHSLVDLVSSERERLSDSLQSVLEIISETLVVAPVVTERATDHAPERPRPDAANTSMQPSGIFADRDVEAEINEDADVAFFSERSAEAVHSPKDTLDPDEELWSKWAKGDEPSEDLTNDQRGERDRSRGGFSFDQDGENFTAS